MNNYSEEHDYQGENRTPHIIIYLLPAALIVWIIILALVLVFCVPKVDAQEPVANPECLTEWYLIWTFQNHKYCSEYIPWGDYELYSCRIQKWSDYNQEYYFTTIYESTCAYTSSIIVYPKVYLPIIIY